MTYNIEMGIMAEHQAPALTTGTPDGYTPTEEEKRDIKLVEKLFTKSKKHRASYDEKWLDRYKFFRGRQWSEARPAYRHSEVINMVFQAIQSQVPILTDTQPKFEYLPEEPSDREFAELMNLVARSDWERNNWLTQLTEVLYDAHIYGTGFSSLSYDPDADAGAGQIIYKSEDPFYCFPDPNATDVNACESRFFVTAKPTDVSLIKETYPENGKYVKADVIDLPSGDKSSTMQVRFKSPVDDRTVLEGTSAFEINKKNQALKVTLFVKSNDFEEEKIETTDEKTGETTKEFVQKKKFPRGKKIVVASGVVLESGESPYEHGVFPYQRVQNYILPREFYGISEIEQAESPQKIFNKLVSFTLDVLTLMGNPIWVVDTSSGIDTDNLFNQPGLIIEKEPNSQVQRIEGVQLQPYVMQMMENMRSWFDGITGATDITRGVKPEGLTAASAILAVQNSAQTRLRQKSRLIDGYLQQIGQQYLDLVMQFYDAPRVFRITSSDGSTKYFKMRIHSDEGEGEPQKTATLTEYSDDGAESIREIGLKGKLDVRVSTGSSLPFAKDERFQKGKDLFQLGVIDAQELLKSSDWPNWEAVLERTKAQAAQQQGAPGPGTPPGPPPGPPAP